MLHNPANFDYWWGSTWKSCPEDIRYTNYYTITHNFLIIICLACSIIYSSTFCSDDLTGLFGCILVEYKHLIVSISRLKYYNSIVLETSVIQLFKIFLAKFTEVIYELTTHNIALSSSCTTNCTLSVIVCKEMMTRCGIRYVLLLSNVPKELANNLENEFPIDISEEANITLRLRCCSVSCNKGIIIQSS